MVAVLQTADPQDKINQARSFASFYRVNPDALPFGDKKPPQRPARPAQPELRDASHMPKRTTGGLKGRVGLLHALAHIEFNAIDLAADIVARFGHTQPKEFISDWISVLDDEARHFGMLSARLNELGSHYGALPAHDGLWEAAQDSADDLLARLAMVPLVHEARGLDVSPATIKGLLRNGDNISAQAVDIIYKDEIGHVAIGNRWFVHECGVRGLDPDAAFGDVLQARNAARPKPPFNHEARSQAGFTRNRYESA